MSRPQRLPDNYPFGKPPKTLGEQYSLIEAMLRPLGRSGLSCERAPQPSGCQKRKLAAMRDK